MVVELTACGFFRLDKVHESVRVRRVLHNVLNVAGRSFSAKLHKDSTHVFTFFLEAVPDVRNVACFNGVDEVPVGLPNL